MSALFRRFTVRNDGLPEISRAPIGMPCHFIPLGVATDAAMTMTVAQMVNGLIQYTGLTAGRVVTTPTAALILAAAADMDIGDTFSFVVDITTAFAITWAAGVGVTLSGRATTAASGKSIITVTKNSATTVTWNVA